MPAMRPRPARAPPPDDDAVDTPTRPASQAGSLETSRSAARPWDRSALDIGLQGVREGALASTVDELEDDKPWRRNVVEALASPRPVALLSQSADPTTFWLSLGRRLSAPLEAYRLLGCRFTRRDLSNSP